MMPHLESSLILHAFAIMSIVYVRTYGMVECVELIAYRDPASRESPKVVLEVLVILCTSPLGGGGGGGSSNSGKDAAGLLSPTADSNSTIIYCTGNFTFFQLHGGASMNFNLRYPSDT